ncbi:hypothetical protein Cgig2_002623 [Carnegiea gigantea]|uniref:Cation efflux protein cytoplasmic domain-containing protein n=1 Tax=Carnegiea gigantea TaxID=171969 RepID=A0A9Q1K0X0_9CARY|nr:hypothetical protein Cgig2_002623 [Carnegiea gigantea]
MGFRFFGFNSFERSYSYLSRISPKPHKNSIFAHYNPLTIQAIGTQFQLEGIYCPSNPPNSHIFKRWHFGHSHHDHHHHHGPLQGSSKESENIFRLGLAADVGLTVGKAVTGYLSGSTAIIADAAHSLSDVVLSSVALLSFKAARIPRDKEHPYGHGKFETLGALGISGMLLVTAGGIAWHAADILLVGPVILFYVPLGYAANSHRGIVVLLQSLLNGAPEIVNQSLAHDHGHHHNGHNHKIDMNHPILALNMTILSIATKEGLFWMTKKAGEREGSGLMKANAWHHRADAISSVVALIGVGGSILGVKFLDPLAGLLVSGMILRAGLETGYQSVLELVDAAVPQQELEPHRQTILQVEGVKVSNILRLLHGCHCLRGRRAGSFLHLDVHIEVDPFTSVSAAHHIGENVRRRIHESHPEVAEVFIHIDPATPDVADVGENLEGTETQKDSGCLKNSDNLHWEHKDIDKTVSDIFSSKFQEKMAVEHITPHLLQNKILLEVEVSMPPDIMIRDAMLMAEEAKEEILETISDVAQVSVQLRLSQPNNHTASS